MAVPFDHIDAKDDSVLSPFEIGQFQRKQAWDYISKITPELNGLEILELNCGDGDDALLFGDKDFNIVATDLSSEMQKITQANGSHYSLQRTISTRYLDLENFNDTLFQKKFDLIFSNFGGLNSIGPERLKKFLDKIPQVLSPGGRFVALIMPRFCLWESMYFLYRFQFKNVFRRWTKKEVMPYLKDSTANTWFYNPSELREWTKNKFKVKQIRPVGFALPPLCLESLFTSRKRLLLRLNTIEKRIIALPLFSRMSDNFLIDLQLA